MSGDPNANLAEALERFPQYVDAEVQRTAPLQPSAQALAESLAGLPACVAAEIAARHAGKANDYRVAIFREPRRSDETAGDDSAVEDPDAVTDAGGDSAPNYGRPLDADALVSTGIVGMLLDGADLEVRAVAEDLASYLAGPTICPHLGLRRSRRQPDNR
jgi:hypothetical protein